MYGGESTVGMKGSRPLRGRGGCVAVIDVLREQMLFRP
jgi:hypothetical protein